MKKMIAVIFGIGLIAGAYFAGPTLFMLWQQVVPSIANSVHFPIQFYGSSRWLAIAGVALAWRSLLLRPQYPETTERPMARSFTRSVVLVLCGFILGIFAVLGVVVCDQLLWFGSTYNQVFPENPNLWINLVEPVDALTNPLGISFIAFDGHLSFQINGLNDYLSISDWAIGLAMEVVNFLLLYWLIGTVVKKISSRTRLRREEIVQNKLRQARIALSVMLVLIGYFSTPVAEYDNVTYTDSWANAFIVLGIYDLLTIVFSIAAAWLYLKGIRRFLAGYTPETAGTLDSEDARSSWPPAPKP